MVICFSVLHYQNDSDTIKCVDSILELPPYGHDVYVVIVDNASPNNSFTHLIHKYSDEERVFLLHSNVNVGFARGNNIGYRYSKNALKAEIIVVLNNDVVIEQNDFIEVLTQIIAQKNADMVGPKIINTYNHNQNPLRIYRLSSINIIKDLMYNFFMGYIVYAIPVINHKIARILAARRVDKQILKESKCNDEREMRNVILHGAAICYCNNYIQNEDHAFLEETFLFGEEDLLFDYAKKKHYVSLYSPRIRIKHNEDSSIQLITKNELNKRKFMSKHKVHSLLTLIRVRITK